MNYIKGDMSVPRKPSNSPDALYSADVFMVILPAKEPGEITR
jgi:hypothetical protein